MALFANTMALFADAMALFADAMALFANTMPLQGMAKFNLLQINEMLYLADYVV